MSSRGRPTDYNEKLHPRWAWSLAILGKTELEIAKAMGIGYSTLKLWKSKYPEFLAAINTTRDEADADVVASLYQRARGYVAYEDKVTKDGDIVRCAIDVPPDVAACIFWLKNREPARWRDKQDVALSGTVRQQTIDLKKMTKQDLQAAIALARKIEK